MAKFHRRTPAPLVAGDYQSFRVYVREDFHRICAYCLLEEQLAGGEENFELDHFRPQSRFPELAEDFYNLYYACHVCNRIKSDKWPSIALQGRGIGIVDLCRDDFETHFRERDNGTWEPLTPSAAYTIDLLRLNRSHLVLLRKLIRTIQEHRRLDQGQ